MALSFGYEAGWCLQTVLCTTAHHQKKNRSRRRFTVLRNFSICLSVSSTCFWFCLQNEMLFDLVHLLFSPFYYRLHLKRPLNFISCANISKKKKAKNNFGLWWINIHKRMMKFYSPKRLDCDYVFVE